MAHTSVEFRGNFKSWFGIWIVNLLLSIITLGIYTAWAKVRTKKYFYQNTEIEGRNFDYHATGMQILIGRLIILGGFIFLTITSAISPVLYLIFVLVLIALMPYLLWRSICFNARNTSWSNVRFNFEGEISGAYKVFLGLPILVALTLYTTFPFLDRARHRYFINGYRLGKSEFSFDSKIAPFYLAFIGFFAALIIGIPLFIFMAQDFFMSSALGLPPSQGAVIGFFAGYAILILLMVMGGVIYQALIRNHIYAHMKLDDHGFMSNVTLMGLIALVLTNALLIIFSFGLLIPLAQIRSQKYFAAHTFVDVNGSLDEFEGKIIEDQRAIGDAYTDFDTDIGIGI